MKFEEYGFTQRQCDEMQKLFAKYSEIEKIILFGSRAKNTFKPASDVDIVLFGENVSLRTVSNLKSDLSDSNLPYFFDVLDYHTISSDELKEHIKIFGKEIYKINQLDR